MLLTCEQAPMIAFFNIKIWHQSYIYSPINVPSPIFPTTLTSPSFKSGVSVKTKLYFIIYIISISASADIVQRLPKEVLSPLLHCFVFHNK